MAEEAEDVPVPWTYSNRFKAMVIIAKVSGALSIVASFFIIRHILDKRHRAQNLSMMRNRILLMFSFGDVVHSSCHFLGTWMAPAGLAWGSAGNATTCTLLGGLTHFSSVLTVFLNASLAICYVLVVCFGWKDDQLRKPLPQFFFFGFPLLVPLGIVTWCLIDQAYNYNTGWLCYIHEYPKGCTVDPDVECERGGHAKIIESINVPVVYWVPTIIVFISCVMLWWAVRRKEVESERFNFDGKRNRTMSNRIAIQGIYYSGVFFVTYMFFYAFTIIKLLGDGTFPLWMLLAHVFMGPIQGVLNAFVYFRPLYWARKRMKREEKERRRKQDEREEKERSMKQLEMESAKLNYARVDDENQSNEDATSREDTLRTCDSSKLHSSARLNCAQGDDDDQSKEDVTSREDAPQTHDSSNLR